MLELNTDIFEETVRQDMPVAVDFWAGWCMPCKMFAPVLEELSDELDGKAVFAKVNVDDYGDLAGRFGIASIPTLLIFKGGELQDRMVGVRPKQEVLDAVSKYM